MIQRLAGESDEAFVLRVEGVARRAGESDAVFARRLSGTLPPLDPWRLVISGAGPALRVVLEGVPPTIPARTAGETDEAYTLRVRTARAALSLVQETGETDAVFAKREKAAAATFPDAAAIGKTAFVDAPADANILFGRFIDFLRAQGHVVTSALFYPGHTGENPPYDITEGDLANIRFYRADKLGAVKPKAKKATKKATKKR